MHLKVYTKHLAFRLGRRMDHSLCSFVGVRENTHRANTSQARGCSSAGRAPALQAGGQEFEPPHLHQFGLIAQVVRARA